jgi:hypothetical protein
MPPLVAKTMTSLWLEVGRPGSADAVDEICAAGTQSRLPPRSSRRARKSLAGAGPRRVIGKSEPHALLPLPSLPACSVLGPSMGAELLAWVSVTIVRKSRWKLRWMD